jgi:ribonuclease HIII
METEDMKDLRQEYNSLKEILTRQGWIVEPCQAIDYGIQFSIGSAGWNGTVRIYQNKKGQLKYDYSQLRGVKEAEHIIETIESAKGFKNECELELPLIGCDESGKGDYFGPLVCAAVYVDITMESALRAAGVRDCKKIPDSQIRLLASRVAALVQNKYSVLILEPEQYNRMYKNFLSQKKRLNYLLAWAHGEALGKILQVVPCQRILIDKFADEEVILNSISPLKDLEIYLYENAEQNIAVAAASVMARSAFLGSLEKLSSIYDIPFLKGSSSAVLNQTRQFLQHHDLDTLAKVAKLHFRITVQSLEFDF